MIHKKETHTNFYLRFQISIFGALFTFSFLNISYISNNAQITTQNLFYGKISGFNPIIQSNGKKESDFFNHKLANFNSESYLQKNSAFNPIIESKIQWRQFPPNLKKNPPHNSVEAVPTKSQKESAPQFCGVSSHQISKIIPPKILWRQFPQNLKKNLPLNSVEAVPKNHHIQIHFDKNLTRDLKKKPPQNSVETVPAESQKESAPKFYGGSSHQISKRIRPKILWRQFPRIITYESISKNT